MATVGKLIRVANPRRKRVKVKAKRTRKKRTFRNRLGHFVKRKRANSGKARRAKKLRRAEDSKWWGARNPRTRKYKRKSKRKASTGIVGMLRTELRRLGVASNPRRRSKARSKRSYRKRRVSNPVLIELGAVNPRRRRSHMAKRRTKKYHRRRNPRRVARRRRNSPPAWAKAFGYRRRTTNRSAIWT